MCAVEEDYMAHGPTSAETCRLFGASCHLASRVNYTQANLWKDARSRSFLVYAKGSSNQIVGFHGPKTIQRMEIGT